MKLLYKLEAKILNLIPKKLKNSQLFFFGLLLLSFPVTILFAQQFDGENMQRIASESVTPITPPGPSIAISVSPSPTCTPRPACLDLGRFACKIAEPKEGWCPPTTTTPTPTQEPVCTPAQLTTYKLQNRCFFGGFKSATITCNDGYTTTLNFRSCQSASSIYKEGLNACKNRCAEGENPQPTPVVTNAPQPTQKPTSPPRRSRGWFPF